MNTTTSREIAIPSGGQTLQGTLTIPENTQGIILFAHGSGSSRQSPRNRHVASILQQANLGTLLMDLLTKDEERVDAITGHLRFDIPFLADRLTSVTRYVQHANETSALPIGYFGASTGAAAALVAASRQHEVVRAIVSRGGRPDMAGEALAQVHAPTLLIVGGMDFPVIQMNRDALSRLLVAEKRLEIVPGAGHLFEEPGTLDLVAKLARQWFVRYVNHSAMHSPWNVPQPVEV